MSSNQQKENRMRITSKGRVPEIIAGLMCRLGYRLENAGRTLYERFQEDASAE